LRKNPWFALHGGCPRIRRSVSALFTWGRGVLVAAGRSQLSSFRRDGEVVMLMVGLVFCRNPDSVSAGWLRLAFQA